MALEFRGSESGLDAFRDDVTLELSEGAQASKVFVMQGRCCSTFRCTAQVQLQTVQFFLLKMANGAITKQSCLSREHLTGGSCMWYNYISSEFAHL